MAERQHRDSRCPKSESRTWSAWLQYIAERARKRWRTRVLLFLKKKVTIQVDIIFVEPPPPGKAERIDGMYKDDRRTLRRSPRRCHLLEKRCLNCRTKQS